MKIQSVLVILSIVLLSAQCKKDEPEEVVPEIRFSNDISAFENSTNATFEFEVKLNESSDNTVTVLYETEAISASVGVDYEETSGTLSFSPGQTSKLISVTIVVDEFLEGDEQFKVVLSSPVNGFLKDNSQEAIGTIKNDDSILQVTDEGYVSADSYAGKTLVWSDEFEGDEISSANWTYDIGANGWGNNELQNYTSSDQNSYVSDGKLFIVAREESGQYSSARLKSIGLQEYQFGRIDVRAIVPIDQGSWPAIWMLGANFPSEGWPSCGEIDIMELVGSNPRRIHGTVHFGSDPSQHQMNGTGVSLMFPETYADEFHVFSVEWSENSISWLMDDVEYHSITDADMNGQPYPFNEAFFFILNVAVGGDWPGSPDETSTFPEFMAVDYVRVYQ